MLRLPGGGTRQRRAAPPDRRTPATGLPEPAPAAAPPEPAAATAPPEPAAAHRAARAGRRATMRPQAAPATAPAAAAAGPALGSGSDDAGRPAAVPDPMAAVLAPAGDGHGEGQVSLGTLLARAGRLMGALDGTGEPAGGRLRGGGRANGNGNGHANANANGNGNGHANGTGTGNGRAAVADRALVGAAAGALRAELRFDDPIACVDSSLLVVAAPLVPGASDGPTTAAHLSDAVGRAVEAARRGAVPGRPAGDGVRHAHVVGEPPPFGKEVDRLVAGGEGPRHGGASGKRQ